MAEFLTPTNILFTLTVFGTIFGIYNYFRNPQISSDKQEAVSAQLIAEISKRLITLEAAFQTHVLSDQTSFTTLNTHIVEIDKSVVRLATIIDERIPKGHV